MRSTRLPRSKGWFVLSEVVGAEEFTRIASALPGLSHPVLDFTHTVHIRWRDAESFVRDLLPHLPELGSLRVVGLDSYCTRILRFAWSVEAWDFVEFLSEEAARALGEERESVVDSVPTLRRWVPDSSWTPSVN